MTPMWPTSRPSWPASGPFSRPVPPAPWRLKKEMQKREKILLDALQADLNKSHFEGYMCELGLNLDGLGYLADHVRAWSQPRR